MGLQILGISITDIQKNNIQVCIYLKLFEYDIIQESPNISKSKYTLISTKH